MDDTFSKKQWKFIFESTKKWNLAEGSVRSGKTVCTLFRFLQACRDCPDSQIFMVGHTSGTIYENGVRLIFENDIVGKCSPSNPYKPFNSNLYYINETGSASAQCSNGGVVVGWSGVPQFSEFDFVRTDSKVPGYTTNGTAPTDYHIKFAPQSASSYNWMFYLLFLLILYGMFYLWLFWVIP